MKLVVLTCHNTGRKGSGVIRKTDPEVTHCSSQDKWEKRLMREDYGCLVVRKRGSEKDLTKNSFQGYCIPPV